MDDNSRYFDRTRDNGDNFEQKPFIVSPEFADIEGAGDNARGSNSERNNDAAKRGKLREQLAAAGSDVGRRYLGPSMSDAVSDARRAEKGEEDGSGFKNNVQGRSLERAAAASMPFGKFIAKKAKSMGPFGTIILILMVAIGILTGSQTLAPFAIKMNGLEHFNTLRTSMNRRSTYFERFMLSRDRNYPITKGATIFTPERFKVKGSMKKRLANNKIQFIDDKNNKVKFLVYTDDATGKTFAATANDVDVGKVPSSVTINGKKVEINARGKLDNVMLESSGFTTAFDKATRTLKGHIAGWFDKTSDLIHKNRLKNPRNRLEGATSNDSDETLNKRARGSGLDEGLDNTELTTDSEDGKIKESGGLNEETGKETVYESTKAGTVDDDSMRLNKTDGSTPTDLTDSVGVKVTSKLGKMALAAGGMNLACAAIKIFSNFNQMMAGLVKSNILNFVTVFLEATDKTMLGKGVGEINKFMNRLYKKGNTVLSDGTIAKEGTSAMESTATNEFFSDEALIGKDQTSAAIANEFNLENTMKTSLARVIQKNGWDGISGLGDFVGELAQKTSGAGAYVNCLYVQAGAAVIDFASDIASVFTFGIAKVAKQIVKGLIRTARRTALMVVIGEVVKLIVPRVAKWLTTDFISNAAGGEMAAYAIRIGMQEYAGIQQQSGSGLPATEESLMAFYKVQQEVIASEADYERRVRSPFDVTSKYTFLGSIINSLTPMAITMGTPVSIVSKTMTTLGSSIGSMLPTAKAEGEVKMKSSISKKGNCPSLDSIGVVGDAACNAYFITDVSTIEMDPAEVFNRVANDKDILDGPDNFIDAGTAMDDSGVFLAAEVDDSDITSNKGNPAINPKSKLGKWVIACASRDSQFGVVDGNVMNAIQFVNTGSGALDTVVSSGISMIPFVGGIVDGAQTAAELGNMGWATGENCISEEYKYYSRYSEDQRLMESAGIIEQSAVSALLEDYYKENPIDNSLEGTIARYSGLTKDEVTDTLAAIDYVEFIADYNPKTYGPELPIEDSGEYQFEGNEIIAIDEYVVIEKQVIYYDLRNRTKIA